MNFTKFILSQNRLIINVGNQTNGIYLNQMPMKVYPFLMKNGYSGKQISPLFYNWINHSLRP